MSMAERLEKSPSRRTKTTKNSSVPPKMTVNGSMP
jgi:hypothetical protein